MPHVKPRMALDRHRGFTLVEIMVAFSIAALVLSVAPAAYKRFAQTLQYRNDVRIVTAALRSARLQAVNRGHPVAFSMNLSGREYKVGEGDVRRISSDVTVRVIAAKAATDHDVARIVFLPDGGSSGGSIDLMRASGEGTRLRVDWLLGRVSNEALVVSQ